jgi:excisionase family DNA binding protein
MPQHDIEYLTTKELAELLRIKERKVYDLAASGQVPCSRAMGKLLFPRRAVEAWIAGESTGGATSTNAPRPEVLLGSFEPLLEWALRESGSGLATLLDGSLDGLNRFAKGEGVAAGLHVFDAASGDWNTPVVVQRVAQLPVALVEFAWRERGLIVAPGRSGEIAGIESLRGLRVVPRQPLAGAQVLLQHLLSEAGVASADIDWAGVAHTESDAAMSVLEGQADTTLGLRAMADRLRLDFVPLMRERFDLLVDRAAWFDPPLQRLLTFCRSAAFAARAAEFAGYDVSGLGTVRFNARP